MVIVAGSFVVAASDRDAFIEGRRSGMEASRAEAGCLDYVFAADTLDPERVVLFERWADQAALHAHLAGMRGRPSLPPTPAASPPCASGGRPRPRRRPRPRGRGSR